MLTGMKAMIKAIKIYKHTELNFRLINVEIGGHDRFITMI